METYRQAMDRYLEKSIENICPDTLKESMAYSLFSGGKGLRGQMVLALAALYKKDYRGAIPYAAAIEAIHSYSLIHDDLPALDNDLWRRGKATNHVVFGEATAILAGDGLLNLAYEMMAKKALEGEKKDIQALFYLAKKAGVLGMIAGQMIDMESDKRLHHLEDLLVMYGKKTGALWEAAFVLGGIYGEVSAETIEILEEIGYLLGVSYQIQDDILEYTSHFEILGKSTDSDTKNLKQTVVSFLGLEKAIEMYDDMSEKIEKQAEKIAETHSPFFKLLTTIKERKF